MSGSLPPDIRDVAAAQVSRLAEVVAGLSDADLVAPTRCDGWLAAHLLVHIRLGFAEHALSFAEPAEPAGPDEAGRSRRPGLHRLLARLAGFRGTRDV